MSGKRKVLTLEQRAAVLKKLDSGISFRDVAKELGCGKTQVAKIKAEREEILKEWKNGGRTDMKYFKRRKTVYEDLNATVWDWFCTARSKNIPVSGRLIQEKAMMLSLEMGHDDFTASNGWLDCWQKRYNVKFATLSGEAAGVSAEAVEDWEKRLPDICKGYALKDIFNADETGLFYRTMPSKSMVVKGDPRKGTKMAKERITVMLTCSAAGEKIEPLVIGRAENPRCFKTVNKVGLPVTYRWNKKAWMTGKLFLDWLDKLNSQMRRSGRHILLFVDNCTAHKCGEYSNVKIQFLPPNTTSKLQPLDAGIIATLKAHYRKKLLRHVLAGMDEVNTAHELAKTVTVLDAIRWLDLAWCHVTCSTIQKCFRNCGFKEASQGDEAASAMEEELAAPQGVEQLLDTTSWEDFVSMDDETLTINTIPGEDWEATLIKQATAEDSDLSDCEGEDVIRPQVTSLQAFTFSKDMIKFATQGQHDALLVAALKVQSLVEDIRIQAKSASKQKSIKDFFGK